MGRMSEMADRFKAARGEIFIAITTLVQDPINPHTRMTVINQLQTIDIPPVVAMLMVLDLLVATFVEYSAAISELLQQPITPDEVWQTAATLFTAISEGLYDTDGETK
jgi:hypothetical protein